MENNTTLRAAILLTDTFRADELGRLLATLYQGCKKYDIFSRDRVVVSEEGLSVQRTKSPTSFTKERYDSLIVLGCEVIEDALRGGGLTAFLRCFDVERQQLAAAGNAPMLLLKAGIIDGMRFTADAAEEDFALCGLTMENTAGYVPASELEGGAPVSDGNLLTAVDFDGFLDALSVLLEL